MLGRLLGLAPDACLHICSAALLHDIGKIGIPDAIPNKPGSLSAGEWEVMRRHPEIGARILEGIQPKIESPGFAGDVYFLPSISCSAASCSSICSIIDCIMSMRFIIIILCIFIMPIIM